MSSAFGMQQASSSDQGAQGSGTDSSLDTMAKTSSNDNDGTLAPAQKPSNESTTKEDEGSDDKPEAKKPVAQEYSRVDDDLDYAITTHACTDSGPLPSIWLESKSLKKAIENGTFIDLPNEMKVRVLKYVGAGCHGSVALLLSPLHVLSRFNIHRRV